MCLTVHIQGRRLWILAEATGSGLVCYTGNRNEALHVGIAVNQMVRVHAKVIEHGLEFVVEFLLCHLVIGCVAQRDLPLLVDGDAVVGIRQVFGGEPEVDGMMRDILQREHWRQLCLNGFFAFVHGSLGLADHLDVAHRVLETLHTKVKVVQPERLLELGRVGFFRDGKHRHAVVEHIVAPDLVGAIGKPIGMLVIGGLQQEYGRIGRTSRDYDDVSLVGFGLPIALDHHSGHRGAACVGREFDNLAIRLQGDVWIFQRRTHTDHLRIRFGMHQAREAVARSTANASAERPILFVEHNPVWRVEGVIASLCEIIGELLDTRFV